MADDRELWDRFLAAREWITVSARVPRRPPKYHALPTMVDGVAFDSRREAGRYQQLKLWQLAGVIRALEVHPRYPLQVMAQWKNGPPWEFIYIGTYTADFRYENVQTGELVVEDVKSEPTKTTAYKQRKKHVEAQYGITITEVA